MHDLNLYTCTPALAACAFRDCSPVLGGVACRHPIVLFGKIPSDPDRGGDDAIYPVICGINFENCKKDRGLNLNGLNLDLHVEGNG